MSEENNTPQDESQNSTNKASVPAAKKQDTHKNRSRNYSRQRTQNTTQETAEQHTNTQAQKVSDSTSSASTAPKTAEKHSSSGSKLSIIAILLTLAMGGGMFVYMQQQLSTRQSTIDNLKNDISLLQKNTQQNQIKETQAGQETLAKKVDTLQQTLDNKIEQQTISINQIKNQTSSAIIVQEHGLQTLQDKFNAMSKTDTASWLIAQADYFVKLAGRKIWQDNDYITARLLLKAADASLAEANDPSLLAARQALEKDISALSSISQIDTDGIVIQIMQLANTVGQLPFNKPGTQVNLSFSSLRNDLTDGHISDSISDWKQNLKKNWNTFASQFITIKKRNIPQECLTANKDNVTAQQACQIVNGLIAPDQQMYLRENLRLQLLIAAMAVPRHQEKIYQQSLLNVEAWINAYFDQKETGTRTFINALQILKEKSISNSQVPETLASAPILDKLIQTRVRSLLAQPMQQGE